MKLGFISDLHLEFHRDYQDWVDLANMVNNSNVDLVINAGDIHPKPEARQNFHSLIKVPYQYILGNHDFYGQQFLERSRFDFKSGQNTIAACTLWTDFNKNDPLTMYRFVETLADGHQILPKHEKVLADEIYQHHLSDKMYLETERPNIVVTHHAPSYKSVHPRFRSTGYINSYFASDLDEFIMDHQPEIKLWVFGHTHNRCHYKIGDTLCVNNALGYPGENYKNIDDYKIMIIDMNNLPKSFDNTTWLDNSSWPVIEI